METITTLPTPQTVSEVSEIIATIIDDYRSGRISKEQISRLIKEHSQLQSTIQWHGFSKPYGYSGDFAIIDKIYTHHITPVKEAACWDEYFHTQAAPIAVRNRKTYFKKWIAEKVDSIGTRFNLLNIASGPARDLYEAYNALDKEHVLRTTCVEMDPDAIAFAKTLNKSHLDSVTFIQKNIFRYQDTTVYDGIWSAGLFDYFDDKTFVRILRRMRDWIGEGGEIVIGNFNADHNPSRDYMELLGDWYLHHRTEHQLIDLALQAGYPRGTTRVQREPENVNLFLHINL